MLKRWLLLFRTVRYLAPSQVIWRLRFVGLRRYWKWTRRPAPSCDEVAFASSLKLLWRLQELDVNDACLAAFSKPLAAVKRHERGEFTFQNRTISFGEEAPLWHDPEVPQLWRYHLHYFDYVDELMVWSITGNEEDAYLLFRRLAMSWIDSNRIVGGDAWHPYPLSLRIVNWVNAISVFQGRLQTDKLFERQLLQSLGGQMRILDKTLEFDVRGNHLLKNVKALIWGGLAFSGEQAARWFDRGMDVFEKEVAEQVLRDGGHFERSAGYHLIVLRDCLETAILLERYGHEGPTWLDDAIRRMATYLGQIRRPDGRIPLFKDAAWDQSLISENELLAACAFRFGDDALMPRLTVDESAYVLLLYGQDGLEFLEEDRQVPSLPESLWLQESGLMFVRGPVRGDCLVMDVGKPCPDYLPAHAHADLLSFELCVGGRPVVADSGVYQYAPGKWRDFFRSTRAHNTVTIDGMDQSEVWGSFRVARRARPMEPHFEDGSTVAIVEAGHNGYQRLPSQVVHRRRIVSISGKCWIVLDWLGGTGTFKASSYLHFHPSLRQTQDQAWGDDDGAVVCLSPVAVGEPEILRGLEEPEIQGFYSERFGERLPNSVCRFDREMEEAGFMGYVISKMPVGVNDLRIEGNKIEFVLNDEKGSTPVVWAVAS